MNILAVGVGGFFGAIGRFLLGQYIPVVDGFPFPTLLANWIGCFLLAWLLAKVSLNWHPQSKLAVTTGFFGAFTTFSTFSLETVQLIQENALFLALLYVLVSIVGGLVLSFLGYRLANGGRTA